VSPRTSAEDERQLTTGESVTRQRVRRASAAVQSGQRVEPRSAL